MPELKDQIKTMQDAILAVVTLRNDLGHERLMREYMQQTIELQQDTIRALKLHIEFLTEDRQ